MGIFNNNFFSLAGQVERLKNVKDTLIAAVTGKVQSNTGIPIVDSTLGAVASHPFATAGVVAVAVNPTGALAAVKTVAQGAAEKFTQASLGQQAAIGFVGVVGGSAILKSPKLASSTLNAPSSLANFGSQIGDFIENPSVENAQNIAISHPFITGATAAAVIAAGANTVSHLLDAGSRTINSLEIASNTNALQDAVRSGIPVNVSPESIQAMTAPVVTALPTSVVPSVQPVKNIIPVKSKKKAKKKLVNKKKPKKRSKKKTIKKKKKKKR